MKPSVLFWFMISNKKAPEVTRKRLFLETMEAVMKSSNKVIMENGPGGTGVVPYLPLPEIAKKK